MVIIFGENNKVENIGILTIEEAEAYVCFLEWERERHEGEITLSETDIVDMEEFHRPDDNIEPMKQFWQSAIKRHEEDIKAIDVLVTTLKGFYGI